MTFKKFLSVFVLTFFVKFGLGQVYQSMPQYGYGPVKRMDFDSTLTIPTFCGVPSLKSNILRKSAIAFDTCNNRFYYYNSKTLVWDTIKGGAGGGTIDTTSLSNRINLKLNISDTTNKWVNSVTKVNDSTIRVVKGSTTTDITLTPSATVTSATRLITTVYNKSGATITKGSVVYIDGAHSSILPSIALAQANQEATSAYTYGLVETDISNNSSGIVIQSGTITNLNLPTSTYTDGQTLYLSPTVAGGYTTTKPLAPNHYVAIGTITRAHPTQGTIQIAIRNGFQLDEMSDVSIALVPADSTLLQFSRVDSLWHDVSPTTAIGSRYIKPSDTASMLNNYAKTSVVNLKVNISDTASMLTNYAKTSAVNLKVNISDTATMLTNYAKTSVVNTKLNTSDSTIYFTKYRSDTMRTNVYAAINGKQASGNYLSDDPVLLGQQALGSTIKGVGLGCRSLSNLTTSLAMTDGQIYLSAYYLPFSATITGAKWFQITAGNYTADNYNGIGLYTYSGGTLTLVASSTDDGTIWKSSGAQSKAFSSPYSASAGVYFIGFLYNSSAQTTAPSFIGATNKSAGTYIDFTNSAKINATINSATMSSSISMSSTTGVQATWGMFLY